MMAIGRIVLRDAGPLSRLRTHAKRSGALRLNKSLKTEGDNAVISRTLHNNFKAAAALSLVLCAAACGGGSGAPAPTPAPAPPPAPAPGPAPVSISETKPCSMTGVGAAVLSTDAPTTILDAAPGKIGSVSYCLVKVVVAQAVNIWVTLPMGGAWDGDLRSQGGGVFAGSVAA